MPQEIIDFWFSAETRKLWFNSTPDFDRLISERFQGLVQQACRGELDHWIKTAEGCLALVIVLDQFPLNMYRGTAQSFHGERQSTAVAAAAIEAGLDKQLLVDQRAFLYMPFMHSEDLGDQKTALKLFDQPGLESNLRFARHHYAIIDKYGRFPHRNAALERASTGAEVEYLDSREAFTG